ncbi:MAG: MBL fold metallo-hydrolase [Deltaproteobacteria bacterium]|nr:MBL fold metallo-hydrolase [Deltaproteobacteria bacterium]
MIAIILYLSYGIMCLVLLLLALLMFLTYRFQWGKKRVIQYLEGLNIKRMEGLGTTGSLEILPLIDWYTDKPGLQGETGVSYLIKTDETTILFDVGYNYEQTDPSPLLHNMSALGVSLDDFDRIFVSHNHLDHVGGLKFMRRKSFSLTLRQLPLKGKIVYTPIPMNYPGLKPIHTEAPTPIAKGVCSIGAIPTQLFFLGWTLEQALACRVEGKGIVLIIGCGHQTLPRILERAEALFEDPLYGVLGGLHFPVTKGRQLVLGIPLEKFVGTGKPPWRPINKRDVLKNIELLKTKNPKLVALSAHDSCDWTLSAFREAFQGAYQDLRVGKKIII